MTLRIQLFAAVAIALVPLIQGETERLAPSLNPPSLDLAPLEKGEESGAQLSATPAAASIEWVYHKTAGGAHPDGNEQQMVWLMNRARTDPSREGAYLANTGHPGVVGAVRFFRVSLTALQAEFDQIVARPPAAFDRRIYEGSRVHSEDLIARDAQDHNNQFSRIADAGFQLNGGNASVYAYSDDPVHAHAGFNIDWGYDGGDGTGMQPGRGHRDGLMGESRATTNVGIAMVPESNPKTSVGPLVTSIVYATARNGVANHYNRFLVGTVWEDANDNGFYDPGEGLAGVRVSPSLGDFYAVTADSGGWAIPALQAGDYQITFSGGELAQPQQRVATVGSSSVLVVWNTEDSYLRAEPSEALVRIELVEEGGIARWMAEVGHSYSLQVFREADGWVDDSRLVHDVGEERYVVFTREEIRAGLLARVVARLGSSGSSSSLKAGGSSF